jgi:hypothetical protein
MMGRRAAFPHCQVDYSGLLRVTLQRQDPSVVYRDLSERASASGSLASCQWAPFQLVTSWRRALLALRNTGVALP